MIWRLRYCNRESIEARVDIIKGDRTPIEVVQGSGQPFTLSYKLDKNDKSGYIMTSSADIEIFETDTFNIDDLKTSNETELKVEYFEDNVLTWSGFILPDFFSREIGSPNIVRMTASDRLTALKGVTLSDLPARVSLRSLIERCLTKTGLTLSLASQIQINQGSTNILDSEILSQRLTDVRGRSISCYDILISIMVATNSTIRQRAGQWQVYNKLEHESRTPTIFFDKVERGAIRTIQPVASSVGVYQEYGGGRAHPDNYDFTQMLSGWSTVGGFNAVIGDKLIKEFTAGASGGAIISIVPDNNVTIKPYLINNNEYIRNTNPRYIESANIDIPYTGYGVININVDVNATGPAIAHPSRPSAFMRIAVVAIKGTTVKTLDHGGAFIDMPSENPPVFTKEFERGADFINIRAVTSGMIVNGKLEIPEGDSFSNWKIRVRVYGSGGGYDVAFNSTMVKLSLAATDSPKGNIFKTTQGANYTKLHDVETTIFGDYITNGLDGYFYDYPIDDTSSLHLPNGELSPPQWITAFDTTERPLLHHISRQKSRLFSVAHDILKANINVESFDPLAIFQDCKDEKYVVVSASFDFLRSEVDVELEQIAYDNTILKRDFIYSYFGEGESNIKSIGGIAGGGGGTGGGGGMTSEQLEMLTNLADWWKLDAENDAIYSEKSVYSLKGVSALGLGSEGGGGGGDFSRLDAWTDYTAPKAGWVLSALLGYDLHTRVNSLEEGAGGSNINIATTGAGNAVTGVSLSGNTLTFAKSSTFALSTHNHAIANITGLQDALDGKEPFFTKNTAFNKNFGTTSGTVAQGNDSRILSGQTAYNWGNHSSAGYALNSALTTHTGNTTVHITAAERTNWNDANSKKHTHGNKALLDQITQSNIDVLAKLSIVDGNIKVDTTLWATGGISALGLGDGGGSGGGGVDMLDSWANYTTAKANYYVPASLLVPFRNDTLSRLTSLESGSATSITTTGSGNAVTSISKSGNVITANKGLSFALSTHNHDTLYKPIDYVPSWGEITGKPTTFEPSAHTHAISQVTGLQAALNGKEPSFTKNTAFNKNFGTTSGTVAQGNDSRIINGQTAYGWGNHSLAGYYNILNGTDYLTGYIDLNNVPAGVRGLARATVDNIPSAGLNDVTTISQYGSNDLLQIVYPFRGDGKFYVRNKSAVTEQWSNWLKIWHSGNLTSLSQLTDNIGVGSHIANTTVHITAAERTNWNDANSKKHTHANKSVIDALTQGHINVLNKLSLDTQGNVKVDATLWATGGISALGLGDGGGSGGGGVDMLDSWANYTTAKANYYVPASLLVPFRNDTLSRLTSLESGSATSIVTTGTGNAITSLTKSGTVITANKGLTFALASHTHTIAQITGLQGALDLKATQSDIDTAIDNLEIGGRNLFKPFNDGYAIDNQYRQLRVEGGIVYWKQLTTESHPQAITIYNYDTYSRDYTFSYKTDAPAGLIRPNLHHAAPLYVKSTIEDKGGYRYVILRFTAVLTSNFINWYGTNPANPIEEFAFWDFMFERGNKATDWTPAPEDQVSDWSETDITSFSYIKNKPTLLSQFTDNIGVATHIANKANPHAVTKAQVGLSNVDNTSDASKPISTATQNALNLKANLASPTFTGNVTAPTFIGALTGNASSAAKLQTTRTIAGVSFDGTANINIPFANLTAIPSTFTPSPHTHENIVNWSSAQTTAQTYGELPNGVSVAFTSVDGGYGSYGSVLNVKAYGTGGGTLQLYIPYSDQYGGTGLKYRKFNYSGDWGSLNTIWDSGNLTNLNQLPTRNFSDLQNKPTTLAGYGITDGVNKSLTLTAGDGLTGGGTLEANRAFALGLPSTLDNSTTNAVTATSHTHAITTTTVGASNTIVATDASGGVRGNIIRIGGNWTLELSGTELVFKYNGVIKQRMLSDGTILATGGITALATN